jgi:TetR/AcrR family transcriptional regulator, transcriptional repressor for nem operon
MRYPADRKQQTRARIVRAAARRFRSRGSNGAAISDLMRDLRLTHGGFYRHFDSKEHLFAEAFASGLEQISERLVRAAEAAPRGGALKALIDAYLGQEHCADIANGCPVAALMAEVTRRPAATRRAFQQAVTGHLARMARYVPGQTDEERRRTAGMLFSGMAGTLNVARALTGEGRRSVLEAGRTFYLKAVSG